MATQSLSVTVIRPDDLLLLRVELLDVDVTAGTPSRIAGQAGARLIVHFQPQHVAEQAFWEVSEGTTPDPPMPGNDVLPSPGSVLSRIAGPTRLAFTIPAGQSFDLTIEGVLGAMRTLPLAVTSVARYEPATGCNRFLNILFRRLPPEIGPLTRHETAIELPYRLFLSPDHFARWDHAAKPVEHDGRTELWHTRLGSNRASRDPRVRAVWSPDYTPDPQPHANQPFRTSLTGRDRNELVQLTSNYHLPDFIPTPVATERLMLTTLGAWLDVEGRWLPPGELTVENWQHTATMGRDHYVRVVYAGYLFPIGHRASLVKVTERKFFFRTDVQVPGFVAYDFQRMFIIVRERTRSYGPRDFPFRSIDVVTEVTPNLDKPENSEVLPGRNQEAFWPRILAGNAIADFPFHLVGRDWEGKQIEFTAPLLFVSRNIDTTNADIQAVVSAYKAIPLGSPRRQRPLDGQPVAFAPAKEAGDTTHEAASITLNAENVPGGTPRFRPSMARADCSIPAVKQLLGGSALSTIEWEPSYLSYPGAQAIGNAAQVFAKLAGTTPLKFAADKSGGLAAPDIGISGLSRSLGPVGGPVADMVGGTFDPAKIFGDVKLLAGIRLSDIVRVLNFADASSTDGKLPQLVTVRDGDVLRTKYRWSIDGGELKVTDLFQPLDGSVFQLEATVEKRIDVTTPPLFRTTGELTNFKVVLLPQPEALHLVEITFNSIKFVAEPGKKVDTSVELAGIAFTGILEFVQQLQRFIPMDGFSDPPSLELVPPPDAGVNVGFSLGIPTIGIGIMTLQNISLSAGFYLPFTSKPLNFRFAFCERHQPFTLTVSLFGGGGFFAIDIGLNGVKSIEAALEFGASIALNLGVASGSATIMAGFYFKMTQDGFSLTGYFRACGSLSVLGIITVTVEFYLGLTYASKGIVPHGGHLWGQCRVTVKISILFFSVSVGITLEREFAGSDPTFRQLMAPSDWTLYCDAFDDYPVGVGD
ncbi:MAG TPA: hypothetical protein VEO54_25125 [Thermoanaerobaculia bacterium]|nr:hypothetical protein [Thermoanaerobaculia bacterium]